MSGQHHKRESTFGNVPFIDGDDFDTFHGFSSHETQIINELKLKISNQQNTINELNELNNDLKNENNELKLKIDNLTRKSLNIQSSALPMRDSMTMNKGNINNKISTTMPMTMSIGNTFDLKPLHSTNPSEVIDDELPNIPQNNTPITPMTAMTPIQSNMSSLGVVNGVNSNDNRHTAQWSTAANFEFSNKLNQLNDELFNKKKPINDNPIAAIDEEETTPEVNITNIDNNNSNNNNNNSDNNIENNNENNDDHYINEITMPAETPIVERRQTDAEQHIDIINNNNENINIMNVDNYIIEDKNKSKHHPYMLSNDNSVNIAINQETMDELELEFEKLKKDHDNLSKTFYNLVISKNKLVSILSNEIEKLRTIINDILIKKKSNNLNHI